MTENLMDDTIELMDEALPPLLKVGESDGLLDNAEHFGETEDPPPDGTKRTDLGGEDMGGCWWIIFVGVIATALIVGAFVIFANEPPYWFSGLFQKDPTPTPIIMDDGMRLELSREDVETLCIESGFMIKQDSLKETCDNYCQAEYGSAELACPGCPVCPDRYHLPEGVDPQNLVSYLETAELIIQSMIEVKGSAETLAGLINGVEGGLAQELSMMDSEQFVEIEDAMFEKMDDIGRLLRTAWPPPPHDSSNPLLDAHGRLMTAYLYLISMREEFDNARDWRRPGFIGTNVLTSTRFENMLQQISFARVGLSLAR